jgi:hypothetical protein
MKYKIKDEVVCNDSCLPFLKDEIAIIVDIRKDMIPIYKLLFKNMDIQAMVKSMWFFETEFKLNN